MELDPRACYRALRTRDPRFDGRFFTGVTSTGIYCRPVCPARTPRVGNCRFFACAAAAQEAGFRPCLRCRPESAPGSPPWLGTSTTVSRALRLIAADGLEPGGIPALAARLGVGERHLRRLFLRHVGATPIAVAQTQRLLFAKQLLDETGMPIHAVATAAGFASTRRFNAAMQAAYGRAPRELRRKHSSPDPDAAVALELSYRPPFDWQALLKYLGLRAIPGVEAVVHNTYMRNVRLGDTAATLEVGLVPKAHKLRIRVHAQRPVDWLPIVTRARRLFDLCADPLAIAAHFTSEPVIGPLVEARPGLRVPGAWDGFELAVRAILGQQISVRAATTLAGRLVERFGEPLGNVAAQRQDAPQRLFPRPEVLARADLRQIGVTSSRAKTLQALAARVASGSIELDSTSDPDATLQALHAVPGIGPWTASYIAMRALHEPDAFPSGDLGLRRAFAAASESSPGAASPRPASEKALDRAATAWRPWRAYAAIHLWTWEASHVVASG